jgi:hypothetical protein
VPITAPGFGLRPFREGDGRALSEAVEVSRAELERWEDIGESDRTAIFSESGAHWSILVGLFHPSNSAIG